MKSRFISLIGLCLVGHNLVDQSNSKTLYFRSNSYKIEAKYFTELNEIGSKWASDTSHMFKVFAYADTIGSKAYNEKLSEQRGDAVFQYLTKKCKIKASKIYVEWFGEGEDGAYETHFANAHIRERSVDILY